MALGPLRFTNALGGTADFIYPGPTIDMQSPATAGAVDGTVYTYYAQSLDMSQWEVGTGAYTASTKTFARTTVTANSLGTTAKINFTNPPQVFALDLSTTVLPATASTVLRNYIVNGGMQVSQENGSTAGTTSLYYPVDQFGVSFSGATVSMAQVASATPGGSPNRLRVTNTAAHGTVAAGDFLAIFQKIEGARVADFGFGSASASAVTIQFGVKAPAGTYCVVLMNGTPNRSYVAEYTITAGQANTDVVKSVTIPGDTTGTWATDNTAGFYIAWGLMAGTTFQQAAGSWGSGNVFGDSNQFNFCGTNGNVFELFDVGAYKGSSAPSFELPDYFRELLLCQRYFAQVGFAMEFPVTNASDYGTSASLPVTMRASPTLSAVDSITTNLGSPVSLSVAAGPPNNFEYRKRASATGSGALISTITAKARM